MALFQRGKDNAALTIFLQLYHDGNAKAALGAARILEFGRHDTEASHALQLELYTFAAENGEDAALFHLGLHSLLGRGIPTDRDAGRAYFQRSADGGFADAAFLLLAERITGQPLRAKHFYAVRDLTSSAAAGSIPSAALLCEYALTPFDLDLNYWPYCQQAARANHPETIFRIAAFVDRNCEDGFARYSHDMGRNFHLVKNSEKARDLYQRAADNGHAKAKDRLKQHTDQVSQCIRTAKTTYSLFEGQYHTLDRHHHWIALPGQNNLGPYEHRSQNKQSTVLTWKD